MSRQSPVARCLHVVNVLLMAPQAAPAALFCNFIPPSCILQHLHDLRQRCFGNLCEGELVVCVTLLSPSGQNKKKNLSGALYG